MYKDMQKMREKVFVRPARRSDAEDIARLVVMAWPVDAFLARGKGKTVDDLISLVAEVAAEEDTLYSYRNTVVAELGPGDFEGRDDMPSDGESDAGDCGRMSGTDSIPVVGIMIGYDGAQLHRLRRPVEDAFAARFGASDMKLLTEDTG